MQITHCYGGKNRYVRGEIVCPNLKLIMNWYFPVCHSSLSEVTLIFIHRSRLCVNFKSYSNVFWMEHKPHSRAGCEDDSTSCLKRKLQEQYTRGSLLILCDVNAQHISKQFCPNEEFFSISLFFEQHIDWEARRHLHEHTKMYCLSSKKIHTLAIYFREDPITNFDPATLTFTLFPTPKLNLYPSWRHF